MVGMTLTRPREGEEMTMTTERVMTYDGEGHEVGMLTLAEARERYATARLERDSGTITVGALRRIEENWWRWHDQRSDRASATMEEAEERCAAWIAGASEDGPATE